ncbi:MAG: alpha/beta fold hydrolase [Wenzhouxiangella sp.]|nr:alpha/beta fold hydrolase [Wenzhouxiangella sp.]TVR94574.1 MAG: alpha/beta fold hydrolase [Wenzhouxiangellaceae bacterium]
MPHQQPVIPVVSADKHRFDLIHVPAEHCRGRLLFLPGMGMTARQYIGFAKNLAEHGIETFIHEWRGLGASSLRAGRGVDWGYRELIELDLLAALDALEQRSGGERLLMGGHSLGSQLACLVAARQPRSAAGLVIVAGGAPYWRRFPWHQRWALRGVFSFMPIVARLVGHYPGRQLGFAGREARGVIDDWCRTGRTGAYAVPDMDFDLESGLAELKLPVLGLRLSRDWFVPPMSLQWLLDTMPGCEPVVVTVAPSHVGDKADHYSWMRDPTASAQAIVDWFQSTEATSRA